MNGELIDFEGSNFQKDEIRAIGVKSLSTLETADYWLALRPQGVTARGLYDEYVDRVEPKGMSRWTNSARVQPQLLSELIAGASWRSYMLNSSPFTTMNSVENSFEEAKKEFDAGYACDAAIIAETNGISVGSVMTLVKDLKQDPRIVEAGFQFWSTAVTIASAIYAEGQEKHQETIDTLLHIQFTTGKRYDETTYGALLQASLLSSPEEALGKMTALESVMIHPKGMLKKHDDVGVASKGFLVLAQTVGGLSHEEIVQGMQDLMQKHKLPQDTATRYILSQVNKTTDTPMINRQGSFQGEEYLTYSSLPYPVGGSIPVGTGSMGYTSDTYNYAVAIRLGSN